MDGGHRHALGGVGAALGVVQHLLVGPAGRPLHPGGQPVHTGRLAGGRHLGKALGQVGQGGHEGPVGLADPKLGDLTQQQVQALTDLRLGDPHHPPCPPVGQPVQQHRTDGVQPDLQQ